MVLIPYITKWNLALSGSLVKNVENIQTVVIKSWVYWVDYLVSVIILCACTLCGLQTVSLAIHLIMYCRSNSSVLFQVWNSLYVRFGQNNYDLFINLTPKEQCIEMISALPSFLTSTLWWIPVCLFVLRFYGPVNPMGSCRARSVYLTTRLLGRLSPLSG